MLLRQLGPLLVFLALLAACPAPPPKAEPPHLLYEQDAASVDNPFPDLRFLTSDGFSMRADYFRPFMAPKALNGAMVHLLNDWAVRAAGIEGVGNFGITLLRTSEAVDPASLSGIASRLRVTDDGVEVLEADVFVEHSTDNLVRAGKVPDSSHPEFVVARPSVVLPEGSEGYLVVKRGLKTLGGELFGRGFAFEREAGAKDRIRLAASALGLAEDEILLVLPLKAQQVSPPFRRLAQWVSSAPAPSFSIPAKALFNDPNGGQRPVGVWRSNDSDWLGVIGSWLGKHPFGNPSPSVGQVVFGSFPSRDLRDADGAWDPRLVADPGQAPAVDLPFILMLPKGAKPPGGFRVVIGAHGLNNRNIPRLGSPDSFCLEVAEPLAKEGIGCLGIDAVSHGSRGSSLDFFDVKNLARTRENFRQTVFDLVQLSRLAPSLDVDGDGVADVSPEVGFFGNSLGGIIGSAFMGVDPRVHFGVLNVPGAGLSNVLVGQEIGNRIGLLIVADTGLSFQSQEYYASFPLFRAVAQLFMETGDPINLSYGLAASGKALLLQEGVGDATIPNFMTEDLARSMGVLAAPGPVSGTAPLAYLYRADPARLAVPPDTAQNHLGHNVFFEFEPVRVQAGKFLKSLGRELWVP